MTVSHWRTALARPRAVAADLAVIGGGIAGLSTALHAARRGLRVVLLERGLIGAGASSKNAGFLMRGCADHYADAVRLYGRERAAFLWRWTEENLAALRAEGIEGLSTYQRVPSALLALDESQESELAAAAALLQEDGFAVEWRTAAQMRDGPESDTVWKRGAARAALVNPGDAAVNPVQLLHHIAARAVDAGVNTHTDQEVISIETDPRPTAPAGLDDRHPVVVRTPDLHVQARRALICTNAYVPSLIGAMQRIITPRRGQMFAIEPSGSDGRALRLSASYYANHGSEYFRQSLGPDGAPGPIVVGGCRTYFADREIGVEDRTTQWVQQALEAFADRMLGPGLAIRQRWAGIMGFSPDGLPIMGPVDTLLSSPGGYHEAARLPSRGLVWFLSACTGHGMSMSFRTAAACIESMLGDAENPFPIARFNPPANAA